MYRKLIIPIVLLMVFCCLAGARDFDRNPQVGSNSSTDEWGSATQTADFQITVGNYLNLVDASSGTVTVTLPAASDATGRTYSVVKTDTSTNTVIVVGDSGETISGAASYLLKHQYEWVSATCSGTAWMVDSADGKGLDVRLFGATGDGTTDDSAAITSAIAVADYNTIYFPTGLYKISSDVTAGILVTLKFQPGAMIVVDSGVTLIVNGYIEDVMQQIFDISGGGRVGGALKKDFIRPEWFGALPDGSTDSSAGIDAAIDFADQSTVCKIVKCSAGNYIVETALSYDVNDGSGYDGISLIGVDGGRFGGTTITFKNIAVDTAGITLTGQQTPQNTMAGWCIKNIYFGVSGTKAKHAIDAAWMTYSKFENCSFVDFTDDGFEMNLGWNLTFDHCYAAENGASGLDLYAWNVEIDDTTCRDNDIGLSLRSAQNVQVVQGNYEANTTNAVSIFNGYSRRIKLEGLYFEANGDPAVKVQSCGDSTIGQMQNTDATYTLELGGNTDRIQVPFWKGDIEISGDGTTQDHQIGYVTGDVDIGTGVTGIQVQYAVGTVSGDGASHVSNSWVTSTTVFKDGILYTPGISAVDSTGVVYSSELLTNGGFESDATGWTAVGATIIGGVASGQSGNCAQVTASDSSQYAYQSIAVDVGAAYLFDGYIKDGTSANERIRIGTTQFGNEIYDTGNIHPAAWSNRTTVFYASATPIYIALWSTSIGTGFFDEISIKRVNVGTLAVGGALSAASGKFYDSVDVPGMKTGATQGAAGAAAGELWADSDDDYTIKLGQ